VSNFCLNGEEDVADWNVRNGLWTIMVSRIYNAASAGMWTSIMIGAEYLFGATVEQAVTEK